MNPGTKLSISATLALATATILTGCSHQPKPQPLSPQAFISPNNPAAGDSNNGPAASNQTPAENSHTVVPLPPTAANTAPRPGDPPAVSAPATLPAIGASSGTFMTLGGVVAEVNSTP